MWELRAPSSSPRARGSSASCCALPVASLLRLHECFQPRAVPLATNREVLWQYLEATAAHPPLDWVTPTPGTLLRLAFGADRYWLQFLPAPCPSNPSTLRRDNPMTVTVSAPATEATSQAGLTGGKPLLGCRGRSSLFGIRWEAADQGEPESGMGEPAGHDGR